jgi:ABC-type sugar transport system ATPase subunit
VNDGVGVVLASSDLNEVAGLADRILVTFAGRITAELGRGPSAKEILKASNGFANASGAARA